MKTFAESFLEEYGPRFEDMLETLIGQCYDKQIEGVPAHESQFGVVYETVTHFAGVDFDPEKALEFFVHCVESWTKDHPGKVIVWRVRPVLQLKSLRRFPEDPAESIYEPKQVLLRFRAHVLSEIPEVLP